MVRHGNLLSDIPDRLASEQFVEFFSRGGVKIERIVSTGQASPPGFWYDQNFDEWVCVIAGSAGLLVEGEASARVMRPGDWLELPAHARHRVEWTDVATPTVWLAVHIGGA